MSVLFSSTAFHSQGGNSLFSLDTFAFSVPDVGTINPGDVFKWDGSKYSILFSNTNFVGAGNVNGFSILPNGHFLLTTKAGADLPGIGAFADGDIVEWDPVASTGSQFLAESTIFTAGANNSVDGIHALSATEILFSILTDGNGEIGANSLAYSVDSSDIFTYRFDRRWQGGERFGFVLRSVASGQPRLYGRLVAAGTAEAEMIQLMPG